MSEIAVGKILAFDDDGWQWIHYETRDGGCEDSAIVCALGRLERHDRQLRTIIVKVIAIVDQNGFVR